MRSLRQIGELLEFMEILFGLPVLALQDLRPGRGQGVEILGQLPIQRLVALRRQVEDPGVRWKHCPRCDGFEFDHALIPKTERRSRIQCDDILFNDM